MRAATVVLCALLSACGPGRPVEHHDLGGGRAVEVSEPPTAILFAVGVLALFVFRRRK